MAVIEVSNLFIDGAFTPLAWDIAKSVSAVLPFVHEIVIEWQSDAHSTYGSGYDHSYALIFQNVENQSAMPRRALSSN